MTKINIPNFIAAFIAINMFVWIIVLFILLGQNSSNTALLLPIFVFFVILVGSIAFLIRKKKKYQS